MKSTNNAKNIKGVILSLCLLIAMTLINLNSFGSITLSTISTNTCSGINSGTITLTTSNGTAPYSFIWSNGATDQNLTGLASGLYSVTVTDAIGLTATTDEYVDINPDPTPIIIGGPVGCNSLYLDAGIGFVSYLWSNGDQTETTSLNAAGPYNIVVTVTDINGCIGTTSSTGEVLSSPIMTCATDTIVNNEITLCGATVNFNPPTAVGYPSPIITYSQIGMFFDGGITNVIATATNSCGAVSCTFNVTVIDNEVPVSICQPITMALDNSGNVSIATSDVDGGSFDNCAIASMSVFPSSFTCNEAGDNVVTLTITDLNGNSSSCSSIVTIHDNVLPVAIGQPIIISLDNSGNASIAASDVDGGSFDNCNLASMDISPSNFTCNNVGDNIVTLTVNDVFGNSSNTTTIVTVQDNIPPVAICQSITMYLDNSGNVSIASTDVDGGSFDNCNLSTLDVNPNSFTCGNTGNNLVTLNITDVNGNASNCMATVTIIDTISPVVICQPVNVVLDNNGNASIAASDVDGGSFDNCNIATMTVSPSTFNCSNIGDNLVTLTITDVNGNSSSSTTIVTVYGFTPTQPSGINGNTTICHGTTQTYSVSPEFGATSYTWTLPIGWVGNSTTTTIIVTSGLNGGTISVTANSICSSSPAQTLAVTVAPILVQPGLMTGNTTVCQGSTQTYSVDPVNGATSYTWTSPAGWTGTSITNSITLVAGNSNGNVTVKAINSCGVSPVRSMGITITHVPNQPGVITGPNTICLWTAQTYSISPVSGATSYNWTLPNGWSGTSTNNSINLTTGNASGTISVSANNGCGTGNARNLFVNISSNPNTPGTISGNSYTCQGSTQTYTINAVSGATSYGWMLPSGWSGSSTSTSITVTVGTVSGNVAVYSMNNCGISNFTRVLAVSVNATPVQPSSISGNTNVCQGTSQTYSVNQIPGATSYTWNLPVGWTGTSTGNIITATIGSSSGNVTLKAANNCGSSSIQSLAVTVNTISPLTISGSPANYNYCAQIAPTNVRLTASSGYTSYAWSPSGGNNQTATVSTMNNYTVTATNNAGCIATATKNVTKNCAIVTNLNTVSILGTSAKASWNQSQCAYNYSIRISHHNQNNWTVYTFAPASNFTFSGLALSTQYDWQIQTNCNTSGSINSGWSAIMTFTTAAQRIAEETATSTSVSIYPNPASTQVTVSFSTMEEGLYTLNLTDMTGRVVKSELDNANTGLNNHILSIDGIAKGLYMVIIQKGQTVLNSKLVIE